jgi:hypothetical protein
MAIDPDPIAERQRTISRSELEMDDQQSLEETADIDSKLMEKFDL